VAHSLLNELNAQVKVSVEPDDSNLATGKMVALGSSMPGLCSTNVGWLHVLIEPLYIPTICSRVSTRFVTPGILYVSTNALKQIFSITITPTMLLMLLLLLMMMMTTMMIMIARITRRVCRAYLLTCLLTTASVMWKITPIVIQISDLHSIRNAHNSESFSPNFMAIQKIYQFCLHVYETSHNSQQYKHTLTLPPSYLRIHSFVVILLFSLHLFMHCEI